MCRTDWVLRSRLGPRTHARLQLSHKFPITRSSLSSNRSYAHTGRQSRKDFAHHIYLILFLHTSHLYCSTPWTVPHVADNSQLLIWGIRWLNFVSLHRTWHRRTEANCAILSRSSTFSRQLFLRHFLPAVQNCANQPRSLAAFKKNSVCFVLDRPPHDNSRYDQHSSQTICVSCYNIILEFMYEHFMETTRICTFL